MISDQQLIGVDTVNIRLVINSTFALILVRLVINCHHCVDTRREWFGLKTRDQIAVIALIRV